MNFAQLPLQQRRLIPRPSRWSHAWKRNNKTLERGSRNNRLHPFESFQPPYWKIRQTPSKCPVSANQIAEQFVRKGYSQTLIVIFQTKEQVEFPICGRSIKKVYTWQRHSLQRMTTSQQSWKREALGPDNIQPDFLMQFDVEHSSTNLNRLFRSICMERCKIPNNCRNNHHSPWTQQGTERPKIHWQVSLPGISFKLLARLIYGRINPGIGLPLSYDQAGFHKGRSTVDQVSLHSGHDCFKTNRNSRAHRLYNRQYARQVVSCSFSKITMPCSKWPKGKPAGRVARWTVSPRLSAGSTAIQRPQVWLSTYCRKEIWLCRLPEDMTLQTRTWAP